MADMESPGSRDHQQSTAGTDDLSPGPAKRARTGDPGDQGDTLAGGEGEGEGGEEEGEEGDSESIEGEDVTAQVDAFFADLDVDYQRQKKRLLSDLTTGVKVGGTSTSTNTDTHYIVMM